MNNTYNLIQWLFFRRTDNRVHIINNENMEEIVVEKPVDIVVEEHEIVIEEPEYEICGICLDNNTEPFTTSCNHTFCITCLNRVQEFKCDFSCPLCRSEITNKAELNTIIGKKKADFRKINKMKKYENEMLLYASILPPFNPENYPTEVDFSFVRDEMFKQILLSAYNVITREEKWKFMHDYNPPSDEGFMWSENIEINNLMDKINIDYPGHSGGSMAFTMRRMQFIGVYGYNSFKEEWIRWNQII